MCRVWRVGGGGVGGGEGGGVEQGKGRKPYLNIYRNTQTPGGLLWVVKVGEVTKGYFGRRRDHIPL